MPGVDGDHTFRLTRPRSMTDAGDIVFSGSAFPVPDMPLVGGLFTATDDGLRKVAGAGGGFARRTAGFTRWQHS